MEEENKNHTKCIICDSDKLKRMNNYYDKHRLVKCKDCSLVFIEMIPSDAHLQKHYSEYSYGSTRTIPKATITSYNKLLDEFEKYRSNNRILDIGCGRGWFLMEARKRGWQVFGTEYSKTAIDLCAKEGIIIREGELKSEFFEKEYFDVITSFEVIEHLNNPREEVNYIYQFLRYGGLFYCTTPNFNSIMRYLLKENYDVINYPEHLAYYTNNSLSFLLNKQGFKKLKLKSTGISITRLINSQKGNRKEKLGSKGSTDELLRNSMDKNYFLNKLKNVINRFLDITNLGITLKGWFIKKNF